MVAVVVARAVARAVLVMDGGGSGCIVGSRGGCGIDDDEDGGSRGCVGSVGGKGSGEGSAVEVVVAVTVKVVVAVAVWQWWWQGQLR